MPNGSGAGAYATLTAAQLDQDGSGDFVALKSILGRIHRRYETYWLPMGRDPLFGYEALKQAAGVQAGQAAADYQNIATAYSLGEQLYQVAVGNGTIQPDPAAGGDGAITIGPDGSGFNFVVFFDRLCGDQVA